MKTQCEGCYKRFEIIRDAAVPVSTDVNAPREHVYCPWCGCENGTVEKGSLIAARRCISDSDF